MPGGAAFRHGRAGGQVAARAEESAGRGVIPLLHTAGPGVPPQRLARLLPPHGGKELAPSVRAAAAAGMRPWGAREEDLGVPPPRSQSPARRRVSRKTSYVPWTSPGSGRTAHHTSVTKGRRAWTS